MRADAPSGIIGLGLMGTAMAARLRAAGLPVVGFDIDAIRCNTFKESGGEVAVSPGELARRCRIVIVAVYNAEQVCALIDELKGEFTCSLMICTTTCAPDEIAEIARRTADIGLALVEAPISGTSAELRDGSATALIAGETKAIEAAGAILDILCPRRVNIGNIGDASRTKLAINLILQNNRAALAEGIVFAERLGLDAAAFLAAASTSAAYSRVMDSKGEKMLTGDFTPQSHIAQTLKDAELILKEAQARGLPLPMTSTQARLLRAAIALEGGDSAAIIEAIRLARYRPGEST
jgi:3-hydroxyisobutyrate dehydrogenase